MRGLAPRMTRRSIARDILSRWTSTPPDIARASSPRRITPPSRRGARHLGRRRQRARGHGGDGGDHRRGLSAHEPHRRRRLLARARAVGTRARADGGRAAPAPMRGRELYREHETIPPRGPLAALTVPGAIAGWMLALEAAQRAWRAPAAPDLLATAIRHASDGYVVTRSQARLTAEKLAELKDVPGFAQTFLVDGKPPDAGSDAQASRRSPRRSIISPMPGSTISTAAMSAREIAADLDRVGSPVTRGDLERCRATPRRAALGRARGRHRVQHAAADAGPRLADHSRAVRSPARADRPKASIMCTA